MPSSMFAEMERNGGGGNGGGGGGGGSSSGLEGQRALQLALELSMLGFNSDGGENCSTSEVSNGGPQQIQPHHSSSSVVGIFDAAAAADSRNKKSQNMTECVPVPSSEHVAEIVGRQGCKIKALRAKTNTYIKTPVRGEEPVFVVTGRKEDVNMAKREILSAAEHFSQIRASRKNNMNGSLAPGPPNNVPGQTTIQVRVPYRVVGLVVGPKGATIKRIQQQTHTYIVTPSRDKEPVFEVTGLPDNVETARKEIEAHIAMRTGGGLGGGGGGGGGGNGLCANDGQNDSNGGGGGDFDFAGGAGNELVNSLYKTTASLNGLNALNSAFSFCDSNNILGTSRNAHDSNIFNFPTAKLAADFAQAAVTFSTNGFGLYDTDEGISESPTFDPAVAPPSSMWPDLSVGGSGGRNSANLFCSQPTTSVNGSPPISSGGSGMLVSRRSSSVSGPPATPRLSPTFIDGPAVLDHPPARRIRSDPLCMPNFVPLQQPGSDMVNVSGGGGGGLQMSGFAGTSSSSGGGSMSSSPTDSLGSSANGNGNVNVNGVGGRKIKRDCLVCFECEVVAALVPCGHNLFCMECANRLCDKADSECPVCHQPVSQAIRIYS